MILAPLEGSRAKVWWARQLIGQLRQILVQYRDTTGVHFRKISSTERHVYWAATFTNPEPPQVPLLTGDIVHNLRSSLDLMMCDIARLREKSADKIKFPFAASEEKLAELLKGDIKRLGTDVVSALASLRPYKGGNIALRGLHDLDIADKHDLLIPTFVAALAQPNLPPQAMAILASLGLPEDRVTTKIHAGSRLMLRKGADPENSFSEIKIGPTPLFSKGLPFAEEPVLETLESLAQIVDEIVEAFIRQFRDGNLNSKATPSGDD